MNEEVTNKQIYELLLGMKSDLASVKERVNGIETRLDRMESKIDITNEHVAKIDERLTETEKVKNIFNPKMLEKI